MDRETMTSYGLILLTVMLMAVLLGLGTPMGQMVVSDLEQKTVTLVNNTGVMDVQAGDNIYGTMVIHYKYKGVSSDFMTLKSTVRVGEYCIIEYPEITGYAPTTTNAYVQVVQSGTQHLTIEYEPQTYNIYYVLNGGSWKTGTTQTVSYRYGTTHTLPTEIEKPGYKFAGWFEDSGLGGQRIYSIEKTTHGHKIFYAKYSVV